MTYSPAKQFVTSSSETAHQSVSALAALQDGGWLTVYNSYAFDGTVASDSELRWLNADGSGHGSYVDVNSTTNGHQTWPSIAALADGSFVTVWQSAGQDGSSNGIYLQRFSAQGVKTGLETQVNTHTTANQYDPDVVALSGGEFVVSWTSEDQDGSETGVYMQRYSANGSALGVETRVNAFATADQFGSALAALSGGGFVVTWTSYGHAGDSAGIYQQRYDANGNTLGGEVHVNSTVAKTQDQANVAGLAGGGHVVTWASQGQDGSGYGVYLQRFDVDGNKVGGEVKVNAHTANDQYHPAITALSNGGWAIAWESEGQDGNGTGIYMQVFKADGSKDGAETRVNQITQSDQLEPAITELSDGRILVSWTSYGIDGAEGAVCQRIFSLDLKGTNDKDTLAGTAKGEHITGLAGNDILAGKGGCDRIEGGKGADRLNGGIDHDVLTGGADADIFVFATGHDRERITDFKPGEDRINLQGFDAVTSWADLKANHMSEAGGNVIITNATGDRLVIEDLAIAELQQSDFVL